MAVRPNPEGATTTNVSQGGNVTYKKPFHQKGDEQELILPRTVTDKQRIRIEKLMRNPEKPIFIPDKPKEWKTREPPEFVRDVMGSSAGAGSGEFHVYRGYRRREYARQMFIQKKAEEEEHKTEFQKKLEENQRKAEERTAKKRNKRMKKKQKMIQNKKQKTNAPETGDKNEQDEEGRGCSSDDEHEDDEVDDDVQENCFVIGGR